MENILRHYEVKGETPDVLTEKMHYAESDYNSIPQMVNTSVMNEKKLEELSKRLELIEKGESGKDQKKKLSELKEEINNLFKSITNNIVENGIGESGAMGLLDHLSKTVQKREKAEEIDRKLTLGEEKKDGYAKDEITQKWDKFLEMVNRASEFYRENVKDKQKNLSKEEFSQKFGEFIEQCNRYEEFFEENIQKSEGNGKNWKLERELSNVYSQNVSNLKESGDLEKLLNGEKIKIYTPDKAISLDLAIRDKGENDWYMIMPGNLQIHDMDKLSESQKELVEKASKLQLMQYINEKGKIEWLTVSEENIPNQIGGHSVTNKEKKALLKGKAIVLTDCTENSPNQKPYTAEVYATLKKSGNGEIKPVMSVNPKEFTEKQSIGEKQNQKQKVQTTRRKALDFSVDDNGDTMERSRTIKTTKRM